MNAQGIAKSVVGRMHGGPMGSGGGKASAGGSLPGGIGVGHVAAAERIIEGYRDGKPVELAKALKDFVRLVVAEGDG